MKNSPILVLLVLLIFGCTDTDQKNRNLEELAHLRAQLDSLQKIKAQTLKECRGQIATFLTFQENNAEEAMNFYVRIFKNSRITEIQRHGEDGPAVAGSILFATFELNGSLFACSDSYITHEWTFTPGVSNFVNCTSEEEIQNLFAQLGENGKVLMPLDNYGWSTAFAFVEDRFGVSWQLNFD